MDGTSTSVKARVAVLGTGIMGAGMLDQGFALDVWDRTPAAAAPPADRGATAHPDAAAAVRGADVALTMLATGDAAGDVLLGRGVLEAIRPEGIWTQMGTVGVEATERS